MLETNCVIDDGVVIGFKDVYQKEIVIPEGVTEIKKFAFHEYYGLEKIILPFSLKHIGEYAFRKCTNLKSICVPSQVESIGEGAFYGCDELIYADLLYTQIAEIPMALFAHCHKLKGVFLPEDIKRIGKIAFLECNDMRYFKVPLNLRICESVPPMAHIKCFCISNEIIHLDGLKHSCNEDTKIFISERQYKKFQKEIPNYAEIVLLDNPIDKYHSFYLEVSVDNMESEVDYLLGTLANPVAPKDSLCYLSYVECFRLLSNHSAKAKIISMSFLRHNQVYSIKELFEIEFKENLKDKYAYRYKKEEFDGLINATEEGIIEKTLVDEFAFDFQYIKDYPHKEIKNKNDYWRLEIAFGSGQKIQCTHTNFEHKLYKKLLNYFGALFSCSCN